MRRLNARAHFLELEALLLVFLFLAVVPSLLVFHHLILEAVVDLLGDLLVVGEANDRIVEDVDSKKGYGEADPEATFVDFKVEGDKDAKRYAEEQVEQDVVLTDLFLFAETNNVGAQAQLAVV